MAFDSLEFLAFFGVVSIAYFLLPFRWRWLLLLVASYVFYMSWHPWYIFLLIFTTGVDFLAGVRMADRPTKRERWPFLMASITANLGLLFFFKYANFFQTTLAGIGVPIHPFLFHVALPIGISFYTFQSMAYTIDVFNGKVQPERNILRFAAYVSFFPQLAAGPIERAKEFLPQFYEEHRFDADRIANGLLRMMIGLFKKVAIADQAAVIVDVIYKDPNHFSGMGLLIATYLFAFQILYDFSGYTDMALGAAQVLGFRLRENFDHPYAARSITDFWRRWHMSLTSWFRDYLYIPLGGNRVSRWKQCRNILIVFLASGLWHGAAWTFVCWGAYHGLLMTGSLLKNKFRQPNAATNPSKLRGFFQIILTFHLVLLGWVFFRAATLTSAFAIIRKILIDGSSFFGTLLTGNIPQAIKQIGTLILGPGDLMILLLTILGVEIFQYAARHGWSTERFRTLPIWFRWPALYLLLIGIVALGKFQGHGFIYFQF